MIIFTKELAVRQKHYFFFLIFLFLSTLHANVDYIDYEDNYDREEDYNIPIKKINTGTLSPLELRIKEIDKEILLLKQQIELEKKNRTEQKTPPLLKDQKNIYLTFDDGPLYPTRNILNVLQKENVKATLFFVGRHILRQKSFYNEVRTSPYVYIANHTFSHADGHYRKFYRNKVHLLADIQKAEKLIDGSKRIRLAGRNVWRTPQCHMNDMTLSKYNCTIESSSYDSVADAGYLIYGWDIEWGYDPKSGKPLWHAEHMVKKINRFYRENKMQKPGKLVLLAHDWMFFNRFRGKEELHTLIHLLKKSGWRFDTIDHY